MSRLEKLLVNRRSKGAGNVERIRRQIDALGLATPSAVLELGCGAGDVSAYLARERGHWAVGVDIDEGQVAIARQRHGEDTCLRFVTADATRRLVFPSARFDLVVSQNVFHHMPGRRSAAREIGRVLRPGGFLLWLDLTLPAIGARVLRSVSSKYGVHTIADARSAFTAAGLVEVSGRPLSGGLRHELVLKRG